MNTYHITNSQNTSIALGSDTIYKTYTESKSQVRYSKKLNSDNEKIEVADVRNLANSADANNKA